MSNIRSGGRGFGLPPPSKFRSGHLPASAIPVSRTIPGEVDASASGSDNDMSTDSEEDVYGGRYSLDSSPQLPNGSAARRYGNHLKKDSQYSSDYTYSDVGSSMETVVGIGKHRHMAERLVGTGVAGRYPVGMNGFTEDESDDSAASSEFSTTQVGGSINGGVKRNRFSEGYASSVPSTVHVERTAEKVCSYTCNVLTVAFVCWIVRDRGVDFEKAVKCTLILVVWIEDDIAFIDIIS